MLLDQANPHFGIFWKDASDLFEHVPFYTAPSNSPRSRAISKARLAGGGGSPVLIELP
jgi:hypothetical protein